MTLAFDAELAERAHRLAELRDRQAAEAFAWEVAHQPLETSAPRPPTALFARGQKEPPEIIGEFSTRQYGGPGGVKVTRYAAPDSVPGIDPHGLCHARQSFTTGTPDHFAILARYAHFGDDDDTPAHVGGETGGLTLKWDRYRDEQQTMWELHDGPPRAW